MELRIEITDQRSKKPISPQNRTPTHKKEDLAGRKTKSPQRSSVYIYISWYGHAYQQIFFKKIVIIITKIYNSWYGPRTKLFVN